MTDDLEDVARELNETLRRFDPKKPSWDSVRFRIVVEPEDNPQLGLPETVTTRRGICIKGDFSQVDWDREVEYEFKGGLRAIRHFLEKGGYIE